MNLPSRTTKYRRVRSNLNRILFESGISATDICTKTNHSTITTTQTDPELDISELNVSSSSSDSNKLRESFTSSSSDSDESNTEDSEHNQQKEGNLPGQNVSLMKEELASWACKHNITHVAVSDLLQTLNPFVSNSLPNDARTLLKTPAQKIELSKIGEGSYHYFGIAVGILHSSKSGLRNFQFPLFRDGQGHNLKGLLTLRIGIDGLPLSKSSRSQFWPILGILDQAIEPEPFLIAIYHGNCKPIDVNIFFSDFVNEMKSLETAGMVINSKPYKVRISAILADAPARSFVKQCTIFNGYFGCERCTQKGHWLKRVVYPDNNADPRTNQSFLLKADKRHHVSSSPLISLQIGLVSQVVLDHMHLLFLGVMRKLLCTWVKGALPFRLGPRSVKTLNQKLVQMIKHTPKEFHRKPRSLLEIDHFKATEFRTFLLYTGIAALRDILSPVKYRHFLHFQCAVYILLSDSAGNTEWNTFAKSLLLKFVSKIPILYCNEFLIYNVHNLLHINEDALLFGNLSKVSCFPFEDFMQKLKKVVRGKKHFVQQVVNRAHEINSVVESPSIVCTESRSASTEKSGVLWNSYFVSEKLGNNCFRLKGNRLVVIEGIVKNKTQGTVLNCKAFKQISCLSDYPCSSDKLGIVVVGDELSDVFSCAVEDLEQKCILLPIDSSIGSEKYICVPML
jgi:hypothetical protein